MRGPDEPEDHDDQDGERSPLPGDPREWDSEDLGRIARAVPGVVRLAGDAWLNTTRWSLLTSWRLTRRLFTAATDPEEAAALAHELGLTVGVVTELAHKVNEGVPLPKALVDLGRPEANAPADAEQAREAAAARLRRQGEELLMRSRDVWNTDQAHPAYERILSELAPDEARVLVYLYRDGPQPSVDVRTGGPVGMLSSRLVASGLTMVGARAGLRYADYVPSYLNNLFRLGLVWFPRESLRDPGPYQVLEAQPDVIAAMHSVKLAKVVRRSIHLTPFGADFCAMVLAPDADTTVLPPHVPPPDSGDAS